MIGRHTDRIDNQRAGEVVFTTPRLIVRTWRADDLPVFAALNADPEVMRYLGKELTTEQADELAGQLQERFLSRGFAMLPVQRRSDGVFLGICGISHTPWFPDEEIGWRFGREHWGYGYATESAAAWLTWAFTERDLPRLISVTDTPNARSIAVMNRLGMTFDHEAELEDDGERFRAVVYAISADDWRAGQS
ncbi:MAG: GNAT family N-acetyltransferase [Actinomycetota bacterium]|nr:GNAT family N-acetyltransferase [Actinomycetota bacterium]